MHPRNQHRIHCSGTNEFGTSSSQYLPVRCHRVLVSWFSACSSIKGVRVPHGVGSSTPPSDIILTRRALTILEPPVVSFALSPNPHCKPTNLNHQSETGGIITVSCHQPHQSRFEAANYGGNRKSHPWIRAKKGPAVTAPFFSGRLFFDFKLHNVPTGLQCSVSVELQPAVPSLLHP